MRKKLENALFRYYAARRHRKAVALGSDIRESGEWDYDPAAAREMWAWQDVTDFMNYWAALGHMMKFKFSENEWCGWRKPVFHVLCIAAMIMGRNQRSNDDCRKCYYVTMISFGYRSLYAGWEAMFLEFCPHQMRFNVFRDGDWNM